MKIAGMIGGLGPESTIDYYRSILALYRERNPKGGSPHLLIDSLDVDTGIAMLDGGRLDDLAAYLAAAADRLARAGADFAFMAANSPHLVFDQVQKQSPIPLLSIVGTTCDRAKDLGLKKVGLLGTGFTMRANFYPEEFQRRGIELIRPTEVEKDLVHQKYIGELLKNQFLPASRSELLRIAERMKIEDGVEAVVLAGTELPLLLRDSGCDVLFLDTALIHVEAVVNELLR